MSGVTPEGFLRPSVQDLLATIESEQRSLISASLDQSPEGPLGQINAVFARQLGLAWEALETAYNGFDPDRAEDYLLTALAKLTGTRREAATYSTVVASVNLDIGTFLEAGVNFAHVENQPGRRFTPQADYTAISSGVVQLTFRAENTGEVEALAGTLTVIATPVVGWTSITNAADAELGSDADTDADLRLRRENQLAAAGSSTIDAIRSDILQLGAWIKSCTVFENNTSSTDADGRPPHSFEVLIFDEAAPADVDDLVAQAIWNTKPSGIQAYGDGESGTATMSNGDEVTIDFSRVDEIAIHINMVLVADETVTAAAVKAYIAETADAHYVLAGQDVVALYIESLPLQIAGVTDVTSFSIGAGSPSGSSNVVIGVRELARFDTANITLTIT